MSIILADLYHATKNTYQLQLLKTELLTMEEKLKLALAFKSEDYLSL